MWIQQNVYSLYYGTHFFSSNFVFCQLNCKIENMKQNIKPFFWGGVYNYLFLIITLMNFWVNTVG